MNRFVRAITLTILLLFLANTYAEYPGVTPGNFSVSDSGAANYSLPITVPAGVSGMNPELAVTYNSQGNNGLMGVGFGLSGMSSSIHRCGSSHIVDGKATGVKYDDTDMICMNGQRLIRISGTHWRNGTVYRSEIDSFDKVVYRTGTTSSGAATDYFEVYTRDGEKHIYNWRVGVSSTGLATRRNVSSWLKHVEEDRSGNRIYYRYKHVDGERYLPEEIVWGAKNFNGNRKVIFEYSTNRPDKRLSYLRGIKSESKHRLSKIKTYIDDNLVKEYKFSYQKSPVSGLSRLIWAQQCGSNGGCLPRHEFSWKDTDKGFSGSAAYKLPVRIYDYQDQYEIASQSGDFIDVNNDGLVDYVVSYKDYTTKQAKHEIYRNTGSGWQRISQKPPTSFVMRDFTQRRRNIQRATYADVNGDGYPDIVHSYSVFWWGGHLEKRKEVWINNQNWTWSKSSTFIPPTYMWGYSAWSNSNSNTSIDSDIFTPRESGTFNYTQMTKAHLADINGDGLVDWVVSYRNFELTHRYGVWLNNGTRWFRATNYDLPAGAVFDDYWEYNAKSTPSIKITQLEDINGDGLLDLVRATRYKRGAPGVTQLDLRDTWLNTGSGWKHTPDYKLPDYILDYTRVQVDNGGGRDFTPQTRGSFVDVNGDGLVDWVRSYKDGLNNTIYKYTWLNNGKGWTANRNYDLRGAVMNDYSSGSGNHKGHPSGTFFDINRDGLVDWITAYKNKAGTTVRNTYLNTGSGWGAANADYKFPNILIDNKLGWERSSVRYGGIMDLNGDGAMDYLMSADNIFGNPVVATYIGRAKPADLLLTITNSLDAVTTIIYKSMMDTSMYQFYDSWHPNISYRQRRIRGPMQLVSQTRQSNGIGGNYILQYFYSNAVSDGKRGYQGFANRRVYDPQQDLLTVKWFYQQFPASGMTKQKYVYHTQHITTTGWADSSQPKQMLSNNLYFLKHVDNFTQQGSVSNIHRKTHPSSNYTYAPRIARTYSIEYELGQTSPIKSVWTYKAYDEYNNPRFVRAITVPGSAAYSSIDLASNYYTQTQTTFENRVSDWLIGLPKEVKVTKHAPGKPNHVSLKQTQFNNLGKPEVVVVEPNRPEVRLTATYGYDGFGNKISKLLQGQGIEDRLTTTTYDAKGVHVIETRNAEQHLTTYTHDSHCGGIETKTDANNLTTTTSYDQFCRMTRVDYPDTTWKTTGYGFTPLRIINRAKGQPDITTYFDLLGREIKKEKEGFDGRLIVTEKKYNWKKLLVEESLPYYLGDTVYWTKYYYDAINRVYLTRKPDNSDTRKTYNGLTIITTNALSQNHTEIKNVIGQLKTVIDADGNQLHYDYNALGNLIATTDPMGNQVKAGYDHMGRKIANDDPDMGHWEYQYDVLGNLIWQKDAKDQIITTQYDKLNRKIERSTAEGTSTWEYDTAADGIGRLNETKGPNGYKRRHTYDDISRLRYTYETIDGLQMTRYQRYNTNGKIVEMRYPGRMSTGIPGLLDRIQFSYNSHGYLQKVYKRIWDASTGTGTNEDLWVVDAMDAKGNVTEEHYGNGVSINRDYHETRNQLLRINSLLNAQNEIIQDLSYDWDAISNLTSRSDALRNTTEVFTYDNLNRLENNLATTPDPLDGTTTININTNYEYDVLGNVIYRSDVGQMNYGENGYGPHAVTSVDNIDNHPEPTKTRNPYGDYEYDANGNLTVSGLTVVGWTSFNKPEQMVSNINGTFRGLSFTYGSEFQRITKTTMNGGKHVRFYHDGKMEHITEGDETFWKYYIPVGNATLEIKYEQVGSSNIYQSTYEEVEKQYLFKDHLGSTDVIVDNDGNVIERLSFNAWGKRRNWTWNEFDEEITSSSNIGFTGHKMDDEVGLVNMKARIYDPVIGRFLSPDSIIPNTKSLQSYNRYSYVRNNPLSFTDPTGHEREAPARIIYDCGECRDGSFNRTTVKVFTGNGYKKVGTYNNQQVEQIRNAVRQVTDPGLRTQTVKVTGAASTVVKYYQAADALYNTRPGIGTNAPPGDGNIANPGIAPDPVNGVSPTDPGFKDGFEQGQQFPGLPAPTPQPMTQHDLNFSIGVDAGTQDVSNNTSDVDAAQNQPGYDPDRDSNNDGVMDGPGDNSPSPSQVGGQEGPTADAGGDPNAGDGNHGGVGGTGVGGDGPGTSGPGAGGNH